MKIQNIEISLQSFNEKDYISLTDMARYKNSNDPRFAIQNWMKTRYTVDFLGLWEQMHNSDFNRVEFDTFKSEVGANGFVVYSSIFGDEKC
ncbi:MAG: KilA-N domain-containing protein [Candidatus Berkelbacteria bacterium]|nr:KilA-N domain-containing protein [Candidatus Berkelbacteria bacterium]